MEVFNINIIIYNLLVCCALNAVVLDSGRLHRLQCVREILIMLCVLYCLKTPGKFHLYCIAAPDGIA